MSHKMVGFDCVDSTRSVDRMIEELHIQGFRRFADYRMKECARVNLLVGDNNCGKTTILEALHLFSLGDAHAALTLGAERRGELLYRGEVGNGATSEWYPSIRHFLNGHAVQPGITIRVSDGQSEYAVDVININDAPAHTWIGRFRDFGVRCQWSDDARTPAYFPIDKHGAFDSMTFGGADLDERFSRRVQLLDAEFPSIHIRSLWDSVNEQGLDVEVINALRVVKHDIERIYFDVVQLPTNPRTGVKFRDAASRELLPIGNLGQGIYRMLELSVALVWCKNGIFLVDEIDTALHWSIMGDIWKLVIETSVRNNTQVFATTHSFDCLRGLAWVCDNYAELAKEVSIQSIKGELEQSIPLAGARLSEVMHQNVEVR